MWNAIEFGGAGWKTPKQFSISDVNEFGFGGVGLKTPKQFSSVNCECECKWIWGMGLTTQTVLIQFLR